MPRYSSSQFYNDWRYKVAKDFVSPSGEPIQLAQDGLRTWGNEQYKIPTTSTPVRAAVNCDGSLIAIAAKDDISIFETVNFSQILVCKGHISNVDTLAFQPGDPKTLVSSAQNHRAGSPPADPTIILWNLDDLEKYPVLEDNAILTIANQATETVVKSLVQAQPGIKLSAAEQESLTSSIEPLVSRIIKIHNSANHKTLNGRLQTSFQSEIFSPSGSLLIYLPGKRPMSNRTDNWAIKIYDMTTDRDVRTMTGHTDAVMWTGYSPDESLIGSVAWDSTMCIWDAATGQQKFKFSTNGQNWTGGFSSDSTKFAGTCGDGSLYIYSMSDGSSLVHHKPSMSSGWLRALSWSNDGTVVAVGTGHGPDLGKLYLYDVTKKEVTQERVLSTEACIVGPEYQSMMRSYLECCAVQFVDGGRKVACLTSGDGGIEIYDLESWEKWRFVRPGVDTASSGDGVKSGEKQATEDADKHQQKERSISALQHGGYSMTIWEDPKNRKLRIASLDGDAVRIWELPMMSGDHA